MPHSSRMVNGGLYLESDGGGNIVSGATTIAGTFPGVRNWSHGRISHGLLSASAWGWVRRGHPTSPLRGGGGGGGVSEI